MILMKQLMKQQSPDEVGHENLTNYSSGPRVPNAHLFRAGGRHMLLSVTRGQIYEIDDILAQTIDRTMDYGDSDRVNQFLATAGIFDSTISDQAPASVPVRSLSLAVAQKCNLGCTYCYAQQGNFGGPESSMSISIARAAVDRLLENISPGE